MSVRRVLRYALPLALVLGAAPALAAGDGWRDDDVAAAERYRTEERERAERYRAQVEDEARERAAVPRARPSDSGRPLGERIGARLLAWLEGVLADVLGSLGDAIRAALAEWLGEGGRRPARHDFAAPPERFADWLGREEARAGAWLDGREPELAPAPESAEWRRRDAARARELRRREAEQRAEPRLERAGEPRERTEWRERWESPWRAEERARERGAGG
jgi:hypothetical protein